MAVQGVLEMVTGGAEGVYVWRWHAGLKVIMQQSVYSCLNTWNNRRRLLNLQGCLVGVLLGGCVGSPTSIGGSLMPLATTI